MSPSPASAGPGPSPGPRVLFVEDDAAIRETTTLLLEQFGFTVQAAADGQAGFDAVRAAAPDVALLDVMLPRIDGISLTRAIRDRSELPIILLSARSDPLDVVAGLEAGADDYVTKPYDGPVLVARLRAVLRRAPSGASHHPRGPGANPDGQLRVGDLTVDVAGMSVTVAGAPVRLTSTELRLLIELARQAGIVLTRDVLLERVWDYSWGGDSRLVDVHVQRLRAKIGPERIATVRGAGYKLVR